MTTECYYGNCKHHDSYLNKEDGPFCSLDKCIATKDELRLHAIIRHYELKYFDTINLVEELERVLSRREKSG